MKYPLVSHEPEIQAAYEDLRERGQSHNMADMLAHAEPPSLGSTDQGFLKGHVCGNQFERTPATRFMGDHYAKKAQAAGVNITGKIYLRGLANFPGDPEAWVSDRHDVKKLLEKRNWSSEGMVEHKASAYRLKEPEPEISIAEKIVQRAVEREIEKQPDIAPTPKEKRALREKVRNRLKPSWAKD